MGGGYIKGYLWDGLFKAGYYYEQSPNIYIYHYLLSIMLLFFVGIICEFIYVNTIEYYIKLKYSSGKFLKTIGIDMRHWFNDLKIDELYTIYFGPAPNSL